MKLPRKKLVSSLALLAALAIAWLQGGDVTAVLRDALSPGTAEQTDGGGAGVIDRAFANRQSDIVVQDSGRVIRLLADDNDGSRHQRFVIELASGLTVLIAHNIDLAPRINDLRVGDNLRFRGEYEWNDRGGVIHWTHHDPQGRRPGGWIKHADRVFK